MTSSRCDVTGDGVLGLLAGDEIPPSFMVLPPASHKEPRATLSEIIQADVTGQAICSFRLS